MAEPFEQASLAAAIRWVLEDPQRRRGLGAAARVRADRLWNPARVAGLYAEVYRQALEQPRYAEAPAGLRSWLLAPGKPQPR